MRFFSLVVATFSPVLAVGAEPRTTPHAPLIVAQADQTDAQKDAFENAKELGTVEAWDAFLSNYPDGFYADLARAYVKKLAEPGPGRPAPAMPPAAAPPPPPQPMTVHNGPGAGAWQNTTLPLTANNSRPAYAAVVDAGGIQMTAFCFDQGYGPSVALGMRATGADPGVLGRLSQGLASAPPSTRPGLSYIAMSFADGTSIGGVGSTRPGPTGEVVLYINDKLLTPRDDVLEQLMAGQTVSLSAPPFSASFQLDGSRYAICSVLAQCGADTPSCANWRSARPDVTPAAVPTTPKRTRLRPCRRGQFRNFDGNCVDRNDGQDAKVDCGKGRTWVGAQGRCVCVDSSRVWNGRRCVRQKSKAPDDGQDGKINCGKDRTWVGAQGRCVCMQPNTTWNGSRCVANKVKQAAPCTGGRTRDPQTGRCDCNGDSAWNGSACVKANEPPPRPAKTNAQKAVCGGLQIACSLGQKNACASFNQNCQ